MFIGESKVDKIDWNTVYFVDGTTKEYTAKQLSYIVTDTAQDLTAMRELIVSNVMPELEPLLAWEDTVKIAWDIMWLLEEHNVTNAELQTILSRIMTNRITRYNEMMREKLWKEIDEYKADKDKYEEVQKLITDSYHTGLFIASGKAFWTFVEWRHPEEFLDNVRFSDIKKLLLKEE